MASKIQSLTRQNDPGVIIPNRFNEEDDVQPRPLLYGNGDPRRRPGPRRRPRKRAKKFKSQPSPIDAMFLNGVSPGPPTVTTPEMCVNVQRRPLLNGDGDPRRRPGPRRQPWKRFKKFKSQPSPIGGMILDGVGPGPPTLTTPEMCVNIQQGPLLYGDGDPRRRSDPWRLYRNNCVQKFKSRPFPMEATIQDGGGSPGNVFKELANLKILEDLQLKKQILLKQGAAPTLNSTVSAPIRLPTTNIVPSSDVHMSAVQRQALQHATSTSFGSFVSQDSSFGNLILPVLPRFDSTPLPSK